MVQQEGATKNDQAYKSNVSWIGKAKQRAENCKQCSRLVEANDAGLAWKAATSCAGE